MTKEKLEAALKLKGKIDRKRDRLNDLRETGGVGAIAGEQVSGGKNIGVQQIAVELAEEVAELEKQFKIEQVIVKRMIDECGLWEDFEKRIMTLRYVDCNSWGYIWRRLSYSRSHTFLLHSRCLEKIGLDKT